MKAQINRKLFLQASLVTVTGLVGCAGNMGDGETGDGDGDGDSGTGSGGSSSGSGGSAPGSGGAAPGSGGAAPGSGGSDPGTGGGATGGNGSGGGGGLMCTANIVAVSSGDHSHTATVTAEQLTAGAEVQITTTETFSHQHTFTLTAADITTLKNGGIVTVYTCSGADHEFVLSCDPSAPQPSPPAGDLEDDPMCWD